MSGPSIYGKPVSVGGAISLYTVASGQTTLSRAVSGVSGIGTFTQIYSGLPTPYYLDYGDGQPLPLASGVTYVYQLTDQNGAATSAGISLNLQLNIEQEPLLNIFVRLYQAGIQNLSIPAGISVINPQTQVLMAMPLNGQPTLPMIVVNMDLVQQSDIPIGQAAEQVDVITGAWTISGFAKRIFRVSVLATNAQDRDFYRDAVIGIFLTLIRDVFEPIGLDVRHKYQAYSGQVADQPQAMSPGFYYADILTEFDGTFNIVVSPNYGLISTITMEAAVGDGVTTSVTVSG